MLSAWHLGNVDWLRDLPAEERERLRRTAVSEHYERGGRVFGPTPQPRTVYLLERGLVRIFRLSEKGERVTFGHVHPGEVFGELAAFQEGPRRSYAEALEASEVWAIPRETFRAVLESSPAAPLEVTAQVSGRMRRLESRVEDLVFRNARARLARALLDLAGDFGAEVESGLRIELELTQAALATLVGSTRQTVSTLLGELAEEGLVGRDGKRIVIRDAAGLERAAAATPPLVSASTSLAHSQE